MKIKIYDEFLKIRTGMEEKNSHFNRNIYFDYHPTKYSAIEDLFIKYPFEANDHIIDFGCGKGRVLIMAAYYSCKYITGYEFDTVRYGMLLKNINTFQDKFNNNSVVFNV